jgi:aspartyl-tRNA synthetase
MEKYGTDKPDLRFKMQMQDFAPFVNECTFQAFADALAQGEAERLKAAEKGVTVDGGGVKALVVNGKADYSRKQIEELEGQARIYKAKGMAWMKVAAADKLDGGVSKYFGNHKKIIDGLGAKEGDLILIVADSKRSVANKALGAVRTKLGKDLGLCDPKQFEFAWIVDFPMFEFNDGENRWEAAHHMFTWPQSQYHETMEKDPGAVKADLYDLVLNGWELASGSIRIHDSDLQKKIFKIVGLESGEAEKKFGFLTEAFKYGAPPHGGIAPGLDRLVMIMSGQESIKEVVAFPKNSFAYSPMDNCPGEVDQKQLDELRITIKKEKE